MQCVQTRANKSVELKQAAKAVDEVTRRTQIYQKHASKNYPKNW